MKEAVAVAGRLRRPGWSDPRLLIGVALIAISVVAVTWLLRTADATTGHYAARSTLTPGTVITADDLVIADVRVDDHYVEVDRVDPTGMVVTRTVAAGELIPTAALTSEHDYDMRPVAIRPSQPAAGLERGSVVDVWITTVDPQGVATSDVVAEGVIVDGVDDGGGALGVAGGQTVHVLVAVDQVPDILNALAGGPEVTVLGMAQGAP